MEKLDPYLAWLIDHLFPVVFVSSIIDATGLPFPGRIILVLAGTLVTGERELATLIVVSTIGHVIGDHVLYAAGALGGPRLLSLYCRVSLGSERCIETTLAYFKRFGPPAIMLGRFSFGVRLFAAVLAGCGNIRYWRFVSFDTMGTLVYSTLWIVVGHVFGTAILNRLDAARLLLVVGPAAIVTVLVFRWIRRRRYGAASSQLIEPPP